MTLKNICYGNNMFPGIVTVIPPRQFPTTSTIECFRSSCWSRTISVLNPMKKSILICGTALDIQTRLKKLSKIDSKLNGTIELRNLLAKKMRLRVWRYTNSEYLYMLTDGSLTLKCKTCTIKSLGDPLEA